MREKHRDVVDEVEHVIPMMNKSVFLHKRFYYVNQRTVPRTEIRFRKFKFVFKGHQISEFRKTPFSV